MALAGIGTTKYEDATTDTKELWRRLTADWYPKIFTAIKNGTAKELLSNAKYLMEVLDISDEALCLVILDVKILELLHVIRSRQKARVMHREALQKKDDCERKNEELPDETKEVLKKYGCDQKEKIKRGRKKRRKAGIRDTASSTPEQLEDYNEDTIPEHLLSNGKSMELIKHKHTFASYMQRVDVMCKEEANQG